MWGQIAGAAVSGLGMAGSALGIGSKRQVKQQKELNENAMSINYKYGEMAADKAYQRQKEMYERSYQDESPVAKRKQLEDAGLSVGLMYGGSGGMGGAGTASTAPTASTGQATPGHAPTSTEKMAAAAQAGQMGINIARQQAEIQNIKADTALKEKDAGLKVAGTAKTETETNLILQQIPNEKLRGEAIQWENKQNEITTEIMNATSLEQIKKVQVELSNMEWKNLDLYYGIKHTELDLETKQQMQEAIIKQAYKAIEYQDSQIYKNMSDAAKAQMDQILGPIKTEIEQGNLETRGKELEEMIRNNKAKINQGYWEMGVDAAIDVFQDVMMGVSKIPKIDVGQGNGKPKWKMASKKHK